MSTLTIINRLWMQLLFGMLVTILGYARADNDQPPLSSGEEGVGEVLVAEINDEIDAIVQLARKRAESEGEDPGDTVEQTQQVGDLLQRLFVDPLVEGLAIHGSEISQEELDLIRYSIMMMLDVVRRNALETDRIRGDGRKTPSYLESLLVSVGYLEDPMDGAVRKLVDRLALEDVNLEEFFSRIKIASDLHWYATQLVLLRLDGKTLAAPSVFNRFGASYKRRLLYGNNNEMVDEVRQFDERATTISRTDAYGDSGMSKLADQLVEVEETVLNGQLNLSIVDGAADAVELIVAINYPEVSFGDPSSLFDGPNAEDMRSDGPAIVEEIVNDFMRSREEAGEVLSDFHFMSDMLVDIHFRLQERIFPELNLGGRYARETNIREPRYRFRFHLDPDVRERFVENLRAAGLEP